MAKVTCLSADNARPCFLLQFKNTKILLDCGLSCKPVSHFVPVIPPGSAELSLEEHPTDESEKLPYKIYCNQNHRFVGLPPKFGIPEISVDFSSVDVILLSSYNEFLALPFITEYTNFTGLVYATEPTLQFGRLYMEELVSMLDSAENSSEGIPETADPVDYNHCLTESAHNDDVFFWSSIYTAQDVESCISKIRLVGLNERLDLFGRLTASSTSSGHAIGSCNWVIESDYEKLVYLSASSSLTTHPKALEQQPLLNADMTLITGLNNVPTLHPDTMIGDLCNHSGNVLKANGNVLIPCHSVGLVYDLFECLSASLTNENLGHIPFYFVSPIADSSLAYSNIFAEWLSAAKQSKVYLPECPFPHAQLMSDGKLKAITTLHGKFSDEYRSPCVVFAGHPSLRFGPVLHFIQMWRHSDSNAVVFTEPNYSHADCLAPFQPINMKVFHCPIDTRLNFAQINKLIRELKPRRLLMHDVYSKPPLVQPERTDLVVSSQDSTVLTCTRGQTINVPIKRKYDRYFLEENLSAKLKPTPVKPNVSISMIAGQLGDDNTVKEDATAEAVVRKRLYGKIQISTLVALLEEADLGDIRVESDGDSHIIHLEDKDSLIRIDGESTHVITGEDESVRTHIRDAIVKCLIKLNT